MRKNLMMGVILILLILGLTLFSLIELWIQSKPSLKYAYRITGRASMLDPIVNFFKNLFYQPEYQNIRRTVLTSLEQELEFCEIIKDDIQFNQGEFWLICNNRPFYATYENGNVNYELNGWGFLRRDSKLWNELSNCDFYDSDKKGSSNYQLRFFCPFDLQSDNLLLKIYNFDINSLTIRKESEVKLIDIIISEIRKNYNKLNECKFVGSYSSGESFLWLEFSCYGENYTFVTNLVGLSPPLFNGMSKEGIAKNLEKIFEKKTEIEESEKYKEIIKWDTSYYIPIKVNFDSANVIFFYSTNISKIFILNIIIKPKDGMEIKDILSEVGNYFVLPPFEKIEDVMFLRSEFRKDYYRVNDKIIIVIPKNNINSAPLRKSERYHAS
jgi:hypothetical protein